MLGTNQVFVVLVIFFIKEVFLITALPDAGMEAAEKLDKLIHQENLVRIALLR